MAYQNVGTPRFYINYFDWLTSHMKINSLASGLDADPWAFRTLPVKPETWGWNGMTTENSFDIGFVTFNNFLMILGHNLGSTGYTVSYNFHMDGSGEISLTPIVNGGAGGMNPTPQFDGFSLWELSFTTSQTGILINKGNPPPSGLKVGSIIIGRYYEMPHSPELNLTMTREMDGIKRIRTRGGSDLVKHQYTKPVMWGDLGAWEIDDGQGINQSLSRSGRRSWDLSFNYLSDSDVFPNISNLNYYESTNSSGTYYDSNTSDGLTLLDDHTFYGQVIHKTNGGQLPFIFQPDSNNSNPDSFAICKFDMKEFKFDQVANSVYNMKLKIREVW